MVKASKNIVKLVVGILVICVIVTAILGLRGRLKQGKEPEIITKTTLEKIIDVSELSTFEATYNGIAKVMNEEKPENVDYYVYYEAKVKAGIDFEKVTVNVDNEQKVVTVTLPEVQINDVNVDIGSLEYIFENKKADTSTISEIAYKKCIEDVTEESKNTEAIYTLAQQNAKNVIEALVKPFIEQLDEEYTLEIK